MNKIIAATVVAGSLLNNIASAETETERTYLEFAVYTVKDDGPFPATRLEAEKNLRNNTTGLLWWKRLKGKSGEYADILAWASPEDANQAVKMLEKDELFRPFTSSILSMTHFGHYWAATDSALLSDQLDTAPLIEIALYTVQDASIHSKVHKKLYKRLSDQQGMLGGARLTASTIENEFGDLLIWKDAATWNKTGQILMQEPELADFFKGVDNSLVFALFTRDVTK
ncbi:MAG: hypothetical protein V3U76_20075 [Granulosicoccus sp.]